MLNFLIIFQKAWSTIMALPDKILARKLKKKEKKKQQLLQEKKEDVNTSINGNLLLKIKFVNKGKI